MGIADMRPAIQLGTVICTALWCVAIVTPEWHKKAYSIGLVFAGGTIAELKMNLFSYDWSCRSEPSNSFCKKFCEGPIIGEGQLTELMSRMCAVEEQSLGLLRVGCDKVSIVAIVSMIVLVMLAVTIICNVCGAVMLMLDPGSRTVNAMYTSAPIIQFISLLVYIAVTYDLSDFVDTDQATDRVGDVVGAGVGAIFGEGAGQFANTATDAAGKLGVNDLDYAITFSYSFFIAAAGLVCQSILAWMVCLFVADVRDRQMFAETKAMAGYGTQDPWQQQQWQQQQQFQQGWAQPAQPGWGQPQPQWGQQQQGWGW